MTSAQKPIRKKNAIVVCCTPGWLPLAAATLNFCAIHGAKEIADFFVMTFGTREAEPKEFNQFLTDKHIEAEVHVVDLTKELKQVKSGRFSTATLLRLTLNKFIPKSYDRVLYLDCDVLPLAPLDELFATNMHGKPIAAVEDYVSLSGPMTMFKDHPREIGMKPQSRYFNAGIILFNWPQVLTNGHLEKALTTIVAAQNNNRNLPFLDQDVLNLEFENNWHALPSKYNLMTFMLPYNSDQPIFRHFNSRNKPWGKTWIPEISDYKKFYIEVFSDSSYASIAKKNFVAFSVFEIHEYFMRKFALFSKLRLLN